MDLNSSRQQEARKAVGIPASSIQVHNRPIEPFSVEIRRNSAIRDRSFVLSASLGLLHASAVLGCATGLHGHRFGNGECLCGGTSPSPANKFTISSPSPYFKGGLSTLMGMGLICGSGLAICLLASCAMERRVYELEFRRELWEIHNFRDGEITEMVDIYCGMGLEAKEARMVVDIFAKASPSIFAQLMMVEELGYPRLPPPTTGEALEHAFLPAVLGYTLGVTVPLIPLCIPASVSLFSFLSRNFLSNFSIDAGREMPCVVSTKGPLLSIFSSVAASPPLFCGTSLLALGSALEGAGRSAIFFGSYAETRTRVAASLFFLASAATVFSGAFFVVKHFYPHR